MQCRRTPGTFRQHCSQSCMYSDETTNTSQKPLKTLNFKMSLDASALKNLCLWCEFRLLPIISLLPKNFLTALRKLWRQMTQSWVETVTATDTSTNTIGKYRQQHGVLLNTWNNSFWNSDEEHTYPPPPLKRASVIGNIGTLQKVLF